MASMGKCPCCGNPVNASRFLISLDTNMASFHGVTVKMRARSAEVIYMLASAPVVSLDRLKESIWAHADVDAGRCLTQEIYHSRQALLPLGITIESIFGEAYRLVIPQETPIAGSDNAKETDMESMWIDCIYDHRLEALRKEWIAHYIKKGCNAWKARNLAQRKTHTHPPAG